MGVFQIFQKAAKIIFESWKLMLCAMLATLPWIFAMSVFYTNSSSPLTKDILIKLNTLQTISPNSPLFLTLITAIMADVRELISMQAAIFVVSFILSLLLMVSIIYTAAMTYMGKNITLKSLVANIRDNWKGPLLTSLYIQIVSLGYTTLSLLWFMFMVFESNGSLLLLALGVIGAVVLLVIGIYLRAILVFGLVVSVVDRDCYGLPALGKASELTSERKEGLKILCVFYVAICVFVFLMVASAPKTGVVTPWISLLLVGPLQLFSIYITVAFTVLYCDSLDGYTQIKGTEIEQLPLRADVP